MLKNENTIKKNNYFFKKNIDKSKKNIKFLINFIII